MGVEGVEQRKHENSKISRRQTDVGWCGVDCEKFSKFSALISFRYVIKPL